MLFIATVPYELLDLKNRKSTPCDLKREDTSTHDNYKGLLDLHHHLKVMTMHHIRHSGSINYFLH